MAIQKGLEMKGKRTQPSSLVDIESIFEGRHVFTKAKKPKICQENTSKDKNENETAKTAPIPGNKWKNEDRESSGDETLDLCHLMRIWPVAQRIINALSFTEQFRLAEVSCLFRDVVRPWLKKEYCQTTFDANRLDVASVLSFPNHYFALDEQKTQSGVYQGAHEKLAESCKSAQKSLASNNFDRIAFNPPNALGTKTGLFSLPPHKNKFRGSKSLSSVLYDQISKAHDVSTWKIAEFEKMTNLEELSIKYVQTRPIYSVKSGALRYQAFVRGLLNHFPTDVPNLQLIRVTNQGMGSEYSHQILRKLISSAPKLRQLHLTELDTTSLDVVYLLNDALSPRQLNQLEELSVAVLYSERRQGSLPGSLVYDSGQLIQFLSNYQSSASECGRMKNLRKLTLSMSNLGPDTLMGMSKLPQLMSCVTQLRCLTLKIDFAVSNSCWSWLNECEQVTSLTFEFGPASHCEAGKSHIRIPCSLPLAHLTIRITSLMVKRSMNVDLRGFRGALLGSLRHFTIESNQDKTVFTGLRTLSSFRNLLSFRLKANSHHTAAVLNHLVQRSRKNSTGQGRLPFKTIGLMLPANNDFSLQRKHPPAAALKEKDKTKQKTAFQRDIQMFERALRQFVRTFGSPATNSTADSELSDSGLHSSFNIEIYLPKLGNDDRLPGVRARRYFRPYVKMLSDKRYSVMLLRIKRLMKLHSVRNWKAFMA